jgi:hypothetical protein
MIQNTTCNMNIFDCNIHNLQHHAHSNSWWSITFNNNAKQQQIIQQIWSFKKQFTYSITSTVNKTKSSTWIMYQATLQPSTWMNEWMNIEQTNKLMGFSWFELTIKITFKWNSEVLMIWRSFSTAPTRYYTIEKLSCEGEMSIPAARRDWT